MTLHLIKLCVGADSLDDLRGWMAARMAEAKRRRAPLRHAHVTRMAPKRAADILDGGSLYWVIKGQIGARQRVVDIEPFIDSDGIGRRRRGRARAAADAALSRLALFRAKVRAAGHRREPARLRRHAGGSAARARRARALVNKALCLLVARVAAPNLMPRSQR